MVHPSCIKVSNIAAEGSVYRSRENLEELHKLLEGGFLDDDEDLNRELESPTTADENVEGKKVYVCQICGKECVSSRRGLKRHENLKDTREGTSKTGEKPKKTVSSTLQISQFQEIVKECAKLCHGDSCLPEYTRNMFDFFEFDRQDGNSGDSYYKISGRWRKILLFFLLFIAR